MKKKNSMSSKYITFALIVIIVLSGAAYLIYNLVKETPVVNKVTVSNEIKPWGYTLDDRDSELMKVEFDGLKNVLEKEEIDYENYAKFLAKLYIIDLYTIVNKLSSADIPCLEYIYPETETSFKNKIVSSLYKRIVNNLDNKRTQKLPIVESVEIKTLKEITHNIGEKELPGYELEATWKYETDLGYDTKATLIIVKEENKLHLICFLNCYFY